MVVSGGILAGGGAAGRGRPVPDYAFVGVACVALVPVLAAVWVAFGAWKLDRRLSLAALAALAGLGLVVVVKGFI